MELKHDKKQFRIQAEKNREEDKSHQHQNGTTSASFGMPSLAASANFGRPVPNACAKPHSYATSNHFFQTIDSVCPCHIARSCRTRCSGHT